MRKKSGKSNHLLLRNCRFGIQPHPPDKVVSTCREHYGVCAEILTAI